MEAKPVTGLGSSAVGVFRKPSTIRTDLRARHFVLAKANVFDTGRTKYLAILERISSQKYTAIMEKLQIIGETHPRFVQLHLPEADVLERTCFEDVPPEDLDVVKNQVLDWRGLEDIVRAAQRRIQKRTIYANDGMESTPDPVMLGELEALSRRQIGIAAVEPPSAGEDVIEELSREVLTPPDIEQQIYDLVQRKSPLLRFGQTITVGTIKSPASGLTKTEQELVVDALNFTGRSRQDMYDHLIPVAEVVPVFYRGRAIAFGACNEIHFQNNGTAERLEYLVATQVLKGFYGRGLQTVVNGIYSLQREGYPMSMMRSRSVGTIDGFSRHFSKVSFRLDTPAKMRRAREFARFMGCECDENGIVRNAYETPPHDPERDQQILEALKRNHPKRYNWVMTALEGLGPRDARIFQGKLTWWKKQKFWYAIYVLFKRSVERREKEENATNS